MDLNCRIMVWAQRRFGDTSNGYEHLATEVGVSQEVLLEWIRSENPPELQAMKRMAQALDLPLEQLEHDFRETKVAKSLANDPFEEFRVSLIKSRPSPQTYDPQEVGRKLGSQWLDESSIQIVRIPILHDVSQAGFRLNLDYPPEGYLPLLFVTATGDLHYALRVTGDWLQPIAVNGDCILICEAKDVLEVEADPPPLLLFEDEDSHECSFGWLTHVDGSASFKPATRMQAAPQRVHCLGRVIGFFRTP